MKHIALSVTAAVASAACIVAFPPEAQAAGIAPIGETSMSPAASAASTAAPSNANRTQQIRRDHAIQTTFTLATGHAPMTEKGKFDVRFAGQHQVHHCTISLPKAGQVLQPGEDAIGELECAEDWQLYDNGLSYVAYEGKKKAGQGTLRP